jgi:hypothetical protein
MMMVMFSQVKIPPFDPYLVLEGTDNYVREWHAYHILKIKKNVLGVMGNELGV